MNRESKFRARKIDSAQWVYGHYFITPLTDENSGTDPSVGWFFLTGEKRHCISNENGAVFVIDPNTLGQFTGLKDKNGKEIFDGDIYKTEGLHGYCAVGWDNKMSMWSFARHEDESIYKLEGIEIIGNRYENPDLLKNE